MPDRFWFSYLLPFFTCYLFVATIHIIIHNFANKSISLCANSFRLTARRYLQARYRVKLSVALMHRKFVKRPYRGCALYISGMQ